MLKCSQPLLEEEKRLPQNKKLDNLTRITKLDSQKLKISPTEMILKSAANKSNVMSDKYRLSLEETEKRSLSDEKFKTLFNFHKIEKTRQVLERLDRYDKKKYKFKRKN